MDCSAACEWLTPSDDVSELVAMRRAIYGAELGWVGADSDVAWDSYDRFSTSLVVRSGGRLVASGRLTLESDGPLEVSDLVDWKGALPASLRVAPAAEWSRVMISPPLRRGGLFRRMFEAARDAATGRGARLLAGASVAEVRPLYERLGFTYLELPFRSPFFDASPVYFPAYQVLT